MMMPVAAMSATTEVQIDAWTVAVAVTDPPATPMAVVPPTAAIVDLLHSRCRISGLDAIHCTKRSRECRCREEAECQREGAGSNPSHLLFPCWSEGVTSYSSTWEQPYC